MLAYRLAAACILLTLGAATAMSQPGANPVVVIDTSMGAVKVELYPDKAPLTVKNFLDYVDAKHYDGTIFHRVIGKENSGKDFMIQGGGFDAAMKEKPTKGGVKNEAGNGLTNARGTLAMARTPDPDSATAQFFVNVGDNKFLDRGQADPSGYTVFGRVVEGMAVVDRIKAVKTGRKGRYDDVPVEDVTIKSIRRADKK
ncbi:peptidylprolyl isomerase [Urbifossiella limnaea]|uniref:Peptidyl-prolyl cis-trans isomerase n=1 Tax=Urbifossiella limnaea TaxID=2528023 RepID=A0A517XX51_9BACT|nr:peptidylprolyl isomerase [Urbifossiella limnaea]QDU22092.1 Peptidyl-prolyl cis-trans isomerase B [Urbifossiella limnaea]